MGKNYYQLNFDERIELAKALKKYNTNRQHRSLGNLAPMAYIHKTISRANQVSRLA